MSNEEGEFKKRAAMILPECEFRRKLDELFDIGSNDDINSDWAHMQMQSMLDEARKECPVWWLVGERIYKWRELTEEQKKLAVYKGIDEIEFPVWFSHWFGSSV